MEADGGVTEVVFIGAGNVASSLAPALDALPDVRVSQVYSRTMASASALASHLESAEAVDSFEALSEDADIYIISVTDDAITAVVESLRGKKHDAVWLHTSGSVGCNVLAPLGDSYGVLYPLQTFSRMRSLDMSCVPFFIEASETALESTLERLAGRLSGRVYRSDSDSRRSLHVAAVFACNFANHMWAVADSILSRNGLPFSILEPLLAETLAKAFSGSPSSGQTGPARRGDTALLESHIASLPEDLAGIYRIISDHILRTYNKDLSAVK